MSGLSKRSLLNLTPNCQQSDHHKIRSARPHTHTHTSENQPVQTVGNRANEGTPYYQSAVLQSLSACVLYTLVFLLPLFQPPSPFLSSVFLYSFSLNLPPSLSLLYVSDSFPSSSADEKGKSFYHQFFSFYSVSFPFSSLFFLLLPPSLSLYFPLSGVICVGSHCLDNRLYRIMREKEGGGDRWSIKWEREREREEDEKEEAECQTEREKCKGEEKQEEMQQTRDCR